MTQRAFRMTLVLRFHDFRNEINRVFDVFYLERRFLVHLDIKLFLKRRDQLQTLDALRAQVLYEIGFVLNLLRGNLQLARHHRLHPVRYVVQPGDTTSSIARRFEVPLHELLAANGREHNNIIRSGEALIIPARIGVITLHQAENKRRP